MYLRIVVLINDNDRNLPHLVRERVLAPHDIGQSQRAIAQELGTGGNFKFKEIQNAYEMSRNTALCIRADKGWAVKRARPSKKM